jgi:hypothetical protein
MLCYVGAIVSAFASSVGVLGAFIPLAAPLGRYAWRSSARLIFPLGVFGSASAKSTIRGYL